MEELENLSEKIIEQIESQDVENVMSGEIMEILLNTREQGQIMEQLIKEQIEVKDALITKLHKELDYYKQESSDRFADQLMKAVIKVRKDMMRLFISEDWATLSADELRREYQYTLEDLTDLLEQQNVDPYTSRPGDLFDASIHLPKSEATGDMALNKTIKKSIAEGYRKGDKVLIPERVIVYQYRES